MPYLSNVFRVDRDCRWRCWLLVLSIADHNSDIGRAVVMMGVNRFILKLCDHVISAAVWIWNMFLLLLQPRSLDLPLGVNHRDVGQRSPLDLGMLGRAGHWMNGPPLFGADNRLLQGLNFNGLSSPTNFQNFMNSANLFSPGILPRDFPRRPELDFPSVPYPASLVDQHGFNPFLHLPGAAAFGPFARFPSKSRDSNRNGPGSDMKPEVVFPLDKWVSNHFLCLPPRYTVPARTLFTISRQKTWHAKSTKVLSLLFPTKALRHKNACMLLSGYMSLCTRSVASQLREYWGPWNR